MKTILAFLICSIAAIASGPCDEAAHVNQGISLTCKVIPDGESTALEMTITFADPGTTALTVVIGNATYRKLVALPVNPPFGGKHTYILMLPANTDVQYILVEEHKRTNSAGFGS